MQYSRYSANRDDDMVIMGTIIRELRQLCGARQAEIAERAVINSSYLSALENGNYTMSLRKYLDLCRALNASPAKVMMQFCDRNPEYNAEPAPVETDYRDRSSQRPAPLKQRYT